MQQGQCSAYSGPDAAHGGTLRWSLTAASRQSRYVASIMMRRAELAKWMWDLSKTPLVNMHYHRHEGDRSSPWPGWSVGGQGGR